jgi:ferrous-iron efflux pump FieF
LQASPQKRATIIATGVATLLVCVKLIVGVISGSVALLASAIDSLLDMLISIFNFFAVKKSEERADDAYQYGKGKVQAIAAVIEGTIITLSGIYIIYEAVSKLRHGGKTELLTPSILVMVFSIVVTYALVRYLLSVAKETSSLVIKADALHYKTDLYSNGAVLLALLGVAVSGWESIDALVGLGIGVYIIYAAYAIIVEGIEILLDKALDEEVIGKIDSILSNHEEVTSYHWLRTRTDGSINFVEFHLVLYPNIVLLEAHRIADQIEDAIMQIDSSKRWIVTPHFDPYDDEAVNNALLHGTTLMEK